jgi:SDR family mycofactocin-dependent oxidoreductase
MEGFTMGRVEGKVAFITGAGMGQGRSHAVRLAEEGADIVATDLCRPYDADAAPQYSSATAEQLEETKLLVEKTGRCCITAVADVRDRAALQAAVDAGMDAFGRLDVVCANAGVITFHASSLDIADETYRMIVDICLTGVWNTIQTTAPAVIAGKRGGSYILTSSAAGIRGQVGYAHYAAAKHGVVGLMRSFANELAPHGIRVNTVHPTGVSSPGMGTEGGGAAMPLFAENPVMMMGATNMLPDLDAPISGTFAPVPVIDASEISNAVLFLASDEGRYITGTELRVDAGNCNKP